MSGTTVDTSTTKLKADAAQLCCGFAGGTRRCPLKLNVGTNSRVLNLILVQPPLWGGQGKLEDVHKVDRAAEEAPALCRVRHEGFPLVGRLGIFLHPGSQTAWVNLRTCSVHVSAAASDS